MNVYLALANEAGGYVFKNATIQNLMDIYLVAPHSNYFKNIMDKYVAGRHSDYGVLWNKYKDNPTKDMEVYLAGLHSEDNRANAQDDMKDRIFVLESYYYVKDWMLPYINDHWKFMLDSGAFTFMSDKRKGKDDWDQYTEDYAQFIVDNNVDLFFELDIDSVVGIKEVERLRDKLERLTNKQCIPVWHKSRGLAYWEMMIKTYSYVAIGGIVSREIVPKEFPVFKKLLKMAKSHDTKVHGLGFTRIPDLTKYRFHSVDSTAWIYGNRGGFLYNFNGTSMDKIEKPDGTRLNAKQVAIHNFKQWVKFQKYAERNL